MAATDLIRILGLPVQKNRLLLLLIFTFCYLYSTAQFYNGLNTNFGKNKIQYEKKLWNYYRFDRYETYFTQSGKNVAIYTAQKAEQFLPELEKFFNYTLEEPIKFIIYENLEELKQSNIGYIPDETYNIGGTTFILGTKVLLYFDGSHANLDKQIRSGISQVLINQIVFGDNIGSMVKNSVLLSLPDWYLQGLVSFVALDWSPEIENHVRDGILSGKYKRFNNLTGTEAIYAGHSIWKYIHEKYGQAAIVNVLDIARISKNIESGFLYVLGISFKNLLKDWYEFYQSKFFYHSNLTMPFPGKPVKKHVPKDMVLKKARISPDGKRVAYVQNQLGKLKLIIRNLENNSTKTIYKTGYKHNDNVDYSLPVFCWHPYSDIFTYIIEKNGELQLNIINFETKERFQRKIFYLEQVTDYSYSHDGKMLVLSGVIGGKSDIFVFYLSSGSIENVTKDIYDDFNPVFINNSKEIVFSSNRPSDTIVFNDDRLPAQENCDLFIYNFASGSKVLKRLTQTPNANEILPQNFGSSVGFLSDNNGIYNLYAGKVDSTISYVDTVEHYRYYSTSFPLTNYASNILDYDFSREGSVMLYYQNSRYRMDVIPQESFDIKDKKIKLNNSYYREYKSQQQAKQKLIKESQAEAKKTTKRFVHVTYESNIQSGDSNKIDINNYVFGKTSIKGKTAAGDSLAIDSVQKKKQFVLPRQMIYETEFKLDQVVTQIDFDYLNASYQPYTGAVSPVFVNPGFNILLKGGIADIFEDYRISGGIKLSPSLTNNEYFLTIDNMRRRNDLQWVLYRQTIETADEKYQMKHYTYEFRNNIKIPLSNIKSLRGSLIFRYDNGVYQSVNQLNLEKQDEDKYWLGGKLEYVFDNTRQKGLNLFYGTRWKIFAEYYQKMNMEKDNLIVTGFDFRKYIKLHRTFVWANRIAGSASLGKERLLYFMGGVDNWLFPKFDETTLVDMRQNYAYQTLATNMRGFFQNIRNGSNFAVINSELRLPVFSYFSNRPIKSSFLANFQVVGFTDIGTAWSGLSPYDRENAMYSQIITSGPITVILENIKEPIVMGYGFGFRAKLFGYFLRTDWAWGIEDGIRMPSVFYLSLGLDF